MQSVRFTALFACLLAVLTVWAGARQEAAEPARGPVTVVLVRHAEKAAESSDPDLTEAGRRRAEELARALADVPVSHVFSSQYRRTRATAEPLAAGRELEIGIVDAGDPEAQVAALEALPPGSVALVVGHSNTVPDLVERLGGAVSDTVEHERYGRLLADDAYDRLFVVTRFAGGPEGPRVATLELRFGE